MPLSTTPPTTAPRSPVHHPPPAGRGAGSSDGRRRGRRPARGRRLSAWQRAVMALASVAPATIGALVLATIAGLLAVETMIELALGFGENPGMITFGAMFLCSPMQWWTGRSQVAVRKHLGIAFYVLAVSNGAMFVIESGLLAAIGAPFLVAGVVALVLALPLFLTSTRWAQRAMGMRRWRALHRLTYLVAVALLAHVVLLGDVGLGAVLIAAGFIARIPAVRRRLTDRGRARRSGRATGAGELPYPVNQPPSGWISSPVT